MHRPITSGKECAKTKNRTRPRASVAEVYLLDCLLADDVSRGKESAESVLPIQGLSADGTAELCLIARLEVPGICLRAWPAVSCSRQDRSLDVLETGDMTQRLRHRLCDQSCHHSFLQRQPQINTPDPEYTLLE